MTCSCVVVVCERLPLVAVIVSVRFPRGVDELVEMKSVDEAGDEAFTGFGLKLAVVPDGRPLTESVTCPVKALVGVTVIV